MNTVECIVFHVTDRCQLNCDHCLRDPGLKAVDASPTLVRDVMRQARDLHGTTRVSFTGGEPTLHPEFPALAAAATELGMTWRMVSNGRRFARVLDTLTEVGAAGSIEMLVFSVDGHDEATHDGIRGAGSFRDVLLAIAVARSRGLPVHLQMAIHRRNRGSIPGLIHLADRMGASSLSFGMTMPTGTLHDVGMGMSLDGWREVRAEIEALVPTAPLPVGVDDAFRQFTGVLGCHAVASRNLYVLPSGILALCCYHGGGAGASTSADAVADLNRVSLRDAHLALLDLVHGLQTDLLRAHEPAETGCDMDCNRCLRYFGKPHWTPDGRPAGAVAARERWRGAWQAPVARRGTAGETP